MVGLQMEFLNSLVCKVMSMNECHNPVLCLAMGVLPLIKILISIWFMCVMGAGGGFHQPPTIIKTQTLCERKQAMISRLEIYHNRAMPPLRSTIPAIQPHLGSKQKKPQQRHRPTDAGRHSPAASHSHTNNNFLHVWFLISSLTGNENNGTNKWTTPPFNKCLGGKLMLFLSSSHWQSRGVYPQVQRLRRR